MRCLNKNKSPFYYALFVESRPIQDEYGNDTSEHEVIYADPVRAEANISAAMGETQTRQFGEHITYDKVIVMDNSAPPIDEFTVLWVDTEPELDEGGALAKNEDGEIITPYDYIVKKAARSLNSASFAVSKVSVSG